MGEKTEAENLSAVREARDAVVSRPPGSGTATRRKAMERYVAAESYHESAEHEAREPDDDGGTGGGE